MPKAATLIVTTSAADSYFMTDGSVIATNWATFATFYTPPAGKRLVLKTRAAIQARAGKVIALNDPLATPTEVTLVIGPGVGLTALATSVGFVATGFLEDDL